MWPYARPFRELPARPLLRPPARSCRRRLDFYQFYVENDGRIGGDDDSAARVGHGLRPISERRGYGDKPLPTHFHAVYAYLEASNHPRLAEHEFERGITVRF